VLARAFLPGDSRHATTERRKLLRRFCRTPALSPLHVRRITPHLGLYRSSVKECVGPAISRLMPFEVNPRIEGVQKRYLDYGWWCRGSIPRHLSIAQNRTPRRIHIPDVRPFRQPFKANLAGFHRPRSSRPDHAELRLLPVILHIKNLSRLHLRAPVLQDRAQATDISDAGQLHERPAVAVHASDAHGQGRIHARDSRLRSMSVPPPALDGHERMQFPGRLQSNTGSPLPISRVTQEGKGRRSRQPGNQPDRNEAKRMRSVQIAQGTGSRPARVTARPACSR
jgi:hypothetical protein